MSQIIAEIGTGVVMFLVGSACTYVFGKWSRIFAKVDNLEFGVQSILRDRMTQMHRYYNDKGKAIPQQEVDSFLQMYEAYKKLGGNGYVDEIKETIVRGMPHENH